MKAKSSICVILLIILLLPFRSGVAQPEGTITGRVISSATSEVLPGANVMVVGTLRGSSANASGIYSIKIRSGTYTLRATLVGFSSAEKRVTVGADETITVDFTLTETTLMGEELVVIGSRTPRTVVESLVPVDVISSGEIREMGQTEVNQILSYLAPSFNASHQTIADGSDHINPASLRGLGPDQVLVLVNGKRRHSSALVHVNGTFGRGTVGVDLNAIPTAAIERIEILRDGAAAQYGSDAIAGVINIVLKDRTDMLDITSTAGVTGEGDGEQVKAEANYGFRIGERGYFNVTGEFLNRKRTNRSDPWTGNIFPGISGAARTDSVLRARGLTREDFSMKTGQGNATVGMTFYNAGLPISDNAELYSFGGLSHRNGFATGFYRLPNQPGRVVSSIYPNGFLPEIHTEMVDGSFSGGIRGNINGWDVDLSFTRGTTSLQFNIENSNNASMGASSPTTFDAGRLSFRQSTGNLDIVRPIETRGALNSLTLALGAEFRIENYQIEAGEDASWQLGNGGTRPGIDYDTLANGAPKEPGSQVFPGFQPSNEVNRFRNSISAYAGLESQLTDIFWLDVGGRYEDYSDFGKRVIGKVAGRVEIVKEFALRAAVSSGFRAPSLHQVWFNNVSIQFLTVGGQLVPQRVLTGSNQSPVTKAFGIPDLKEETSVNISAGFTARPVGDLSITADFYHIRIKDRIVLTSRFANSDPIVASILAPFSSQGVTQAQFFANAVDTKTSGVDVVASYSLPLGDGRLTLTGSANLTKTEVEATNIPAAVAARFAGGDLEKVRNTLFDREERNRLEDALPRQKGAVSARYSIGRFSALARASYFGKIEYKPVNPASDPTRDDETFGAKTLIDLDVSFEIFDGVTIAAGAANLFNVFPDQQQKAINRSDGRFIYSRRVTQFGSNGGFYYGRVLLNL